jgi:hypothetical protein
VTISIPITTWLHLMPVTITLEPSTGIDAKHNRTYGAAVTYRARIEGAPGNRSFKDEKGQEKVASFKIFVASGSTVIDKQDRITLPAGHDPVSPPILGVDPNYDQNGLHHSVIWT